MGDTFKEIFSIFVLMGPWFWAAWLEWRVDRLYQRVQIGKGVSPTALFRAVARGDISPEIAAMILAGKKDNDG